MSARDRFAQTRKAVCELATVQALLWSQGDDWVPDAPGRAEVSDPTANRAIYNVEELGAKLDGYRRREAELIEFIGGTLAIIEGVRRGLGEDYANVLDCYYIDGFTWREVSKELGESVSTCKRQRDIACDWVDSLGVAHVLSGDYEI